MAPEVIVTRYSSPAADIYALAITIWEIFHRKYVNIILFTRGILFCAVAL